MDISDIPESLVPSILSSRESPERRGSGPDKKERAKEETTPEPRRRPLERSVELLLSDEARIYQALRDVAERALRSRFDENLDVERANARLDEWNDWTPEGAANAMFRELRPNSSDGTRSTTDAVRLVRKAFRDEQDSIRRAGLASEPVEDHLRETLGVLLTFVSEDDGTEKN